MGRPGGGAIGRAEGATPAVASGASLRDNCLGADSVCKFVAEHPTKVQPRLIHGRCLRSFETILPILSPPLLLLMSKSASISSFPLVWLSWLSTLKPIFPGKFGETTLVGSYRGAEWLFSCCMSIFDHMCHHKIDAVIHPLRLLFRMAQTHKKAPHQEGPDFNHNLLCFFNA
ncbi:hypothetical protein BC351_20625 [Paenibacillus ferrarius]|uniref:Uncharacterized protein n=1 Tax=Paenibacillus ferrarius TaxID=1469647 RepID=A0A1V4HNE9_9BACL|nr:hypothetical protein BC351_20625 [Paenibacillus ferrarius]